MKKWIVLSFLVGVLLIIGGLFPSELEWKKTVVSTQEKSKSELKIYELELERWEVANDGTDPIETTKGINAALIWAKENGYTAFMIPKGTYLIAAGTTQADPDARINMVSDMELILSEETILQKEANEFEEYALLHIGPKVENVVVRGGIFIGDRDDHDYSKKGPHTGGTHEWGYGIEIAGAENVVIDGVKVEKFTGDGIMVSGTTVVGSTISEQDFEVGGIDDKGEPIAVNDQIRTNNREVTHFEDSAYEQYRNIHFWLPEGINDGSKVDVYYYRKDGSFLKVDKQVRFFSGESIIPRDADYFRAVFNAPSINGAKVTRMTVDVAKKITIKNSDIGYNRRQGISLVGSDGVEIINNHIHHTKGTSPESGIDIEPGFFPGINTVIRGNTFTNNKIQIVLAYGENAIIEDNHFEQKIKDGIGVYAHKGFRGKVVVNNNVFKGSGLTLNPPNAVAKDNEFTKGIITLRGENIHFKNATLVDASVNIGEEAGQEIANITIKHHGLRPHALQIGDKQVHLEDVTITAETKGQNLIIGKGNSKSIYERLKVKDLDRKGTLLPAGTYKQCAFDAGNLTINRDGKYVLNDCSIRDRENLLTINSLYGKPDVMIKNSRLEVMDNIGYGAAVYVTGAENFELLDSTVIARNNTKETPLIKIGPYGHPEPTNVFKTTIKGNELRTKLGMVAIHTKNAGTDAPAYLIKDNTIYNGVLNLTDKEKNVNNKLIRE